MILRWATAAAIERHQAWKQGTPYWCPCGNLLAVRRRGIWDVRQRGRRVLARDVILLQCEDCKTEIRPGR